MNTSKYINATELSKRLGLTKTSIYQLAAQKRIPSVRFSERILRFDWDAIQKWISEKQQTDFDETGGS